MDFNFPSGIQRFTAILAGKQMKPKIKRATKGRISRAIVMPGTLYPFCGGV